MINRSSQSRAIFYIKNKERGFNMKKFSRFLLTVVVVTGLVLPVSASAYTIEQDPIQFSYHPGYASNEIIVLHESGNANNVGADSLDREVSYMKRNWQNAYVSFFVGSGGRVKQLAPVGYYQYGAGTTANSKAYAQIELARTNNAETFKKDYAAYVNLTRDLATQAGFTLDLDDSTSYGIKTHLWITQNWWGDHTDPYGYLASWGISKAQLQKDLFTGLAEDGESTADKPATVTQSPKTETSGRIAKTGVFYVNQNLPVSADTDPDDNTSPAVAYYNYGQAIYYDSYIMSNGYAWISYIGASGNRRYVAVGPDDGRTDTTWGTGFFN